MLDLISNSLAAVIILFIIISSMRKPFIPPERIKETLVIRYELKNSNEKSETQIWVEPSTVDVDSGRIRFYGLNNPTIDDMNVNDKVFGRYLDCRLSIDNSVRERTFTTPCAMVYSPIDSNYVHYLIVRGPTEGSWRTGLLYRDHSQYEQREQPGSIEIRAWLMSEEESSYTEPVFTEITGPTGSRGFNIEIVK